MELEVALEKHQNIHNKRFSPDKLPEQVYFLGNNLFEVYYKIKIKAFYY